MSWLFGYVGAVTPALRAKLQHIHDPALYSAENRSHYVMAGGQPQTCRAGLLPHKAGHWLITGLGFDPAQHRLLDKQAWEDVFALPRPSLDRIDGHFIAAVVKEDQVHLYSDQLGTRTLHYTAYEQGYAFSTRLDWLATLCGGLAIDFEAFGSHWLTFNQLSTRSQVQSLTRLGPGGQLTLTANECTVSERPWVCEIGEGDPTGSAYAGVLAGYCTPKGLGDVSLGLSGGLDSRLLLALGAPHTHVFGPPEHPDAIMAFCIAESLPVSIRHYYETMEDVDTAWKLLRERSKTSHVVSAASAILDMNYFPLLREEGFSVIDGGLGEAGRLQFMNRLRWRGSGWDEPAAVLPHIRVSRASIFSKEATAAMIRGALDDIACQRSELPPDLNRHNALDLIGIRTRLPNFFGFEQNRLDGMAACFMPFAQPSVLQALFQVPITLRRNGKLFKQLIRARGAHLTRYKLVKGSVTFPFWMPTLGTALTSRVQKKLGTHYHDPRPHQFLQAAKPLVLDLAHSDAVRHYEAYDVGHVQQLVSGYYGGNHALADAVDWWLALEMWRRTIHATD